MHHGIFKNLDEVIDHYNTIDSVPAVGHTEESLKPLGLSQLQKEQLKAFLHSLNSKLKKSIDIEKANLNIDSLFFFTGLCEKFPYRAVPEALATRTFLSPSTL